MQNIHAVLMAICLVFATTSHEGFAQGLLGKRYVDVGAAVAVPGDTVIRDIDSTVIEVGGSLNIPVQENLDFTASFVHSKLEGTTVENTAYALTGGANYHFQPGEEFNPFLGASIGAHFSEVDGGAVGLPARRDETDFLFSLRAGIETLPGPQVSIRPTLHFVSIDADNDFVADFPVTFWFDQDQNFFGTLILGFGFEEGDLIYGGALGLAF